MGEGLVDGATLDDQLRRIIMMDKNRRNVLQAASQLTLPDCWVAAGFVRNAVWDFLHGYHEPTKLNDIDVIYYDSFDTAKQSDIAAEVALVKRVLSSRVSVKNQSRMHMRNGDLPYRNSADAMSHWPETCTAVGVRVQNKFEICAPFGLDDLFDLIIRPTSADAKIVKLVHDRATNRQWMDRWPMLRHVDP